jgi:hypothetical protein
MTEQPATIQAINGRRPPVHLARCYACRSLLATRGATVRLAAGLVPRPTSHGSGLPRYGVPRRAGHGDPREARDKFTGARSGIAIGNPGAFYVNCPNCDRGQIVRWPASSPYKATRSGLPSD